MSTIRYTDQVTGVNCTIGGGTLFDEILRVLPAKLEHTGFPEADRARLPAAGSSSPLDLRIISEASGAYLLRAYPNSAFSQQFSAILAEMGRAGSQLPEGLLQRAMQAGVKALLIVASNNEAAYMARSDGGFVVEITGDESTMERSARVCSRPTAEDSGSNAMLYAAVGLAAYFLLK